MTFEKLVLDFSLNESPVGSKGRTGSKDADEYIAQDAALEKEFKKIVKALGGKTVAQKLLQKMSKPNIEESAKDAKQVEQYLRDAGFKIKKVHPGKEQIEIELFKSKFAEQAFEDLKSAGVTDVELSHSSIIVKI